MEQRYSQIEKEILNVVYGLTQFHTYTCGRHVFVQNDHKPLSSVLKKAIEDNPLRLQRMLVRIMAYNFTFNYVKVKELVIADAL